VAIYGWDPMHARHLIIAHSMFRPLPLPPVPAVGWPACRRMSRAETPTRAVDRRMGLNSCAVRILSLVGNHFPAVLAVIGNLDLITPAAFRRERQLRLLDGHDAFQIHAQPCVRVAGGGLPGRGRIAVVGQASAVAGRFAAGARRIFQTQGDRRTVCTIAVNRTYGRGFTDGVLPAMNLGLPSEVISIVASFKPGDVARTTVLPA